jgi:hypothetical protein
VCLDSTGPFIDVIFVNVVALVPERDRYDVGTKVTKNTETTKPFVIFVNVVALVPERDRYDVGTKVTKNTKTQSPL